MPFIRTRSTLFHFLRKMSMYWNATGTRLLRVHVSEGQLRLIYHQQHLTNVKLIGRMSLMNT
jgi:hypothetical protein